ncbi:MAG: hypothetical protein ACIAXF_02540 [Phycisphaerales bacterium JB063]
MESEHDVPQDACLAEMVKVIERLRDEGYLIDGPAEEIASVAYRRWQTFERRHKKHKNLRLEERQRDLIKGLQSHFEPTGMYARSEEWAGLVGALVPVLQPATQ